VQATFILSQLDWETPSVIETFRALGLAPAEVARLTGPDGGSAWVCPLSCSASDLLGRLESKTEWSMRIRPGPLVAIPDPAGAFPFAVVQLGKDRLALIPAGTFDVVHAWLERSEARDPVMVGGLSPPERLERMPPAPVRVVLGSAPALGGPPSESAVQALRATAQGVEVFRNDGTVATP
jgi:hypothetical protein